MSSFKIEIMVARGKAVKELKSYLVEATNEVDAEAQLENALKDELFVLFSCEEVFPAMQRS